MKTWIVPVLALSLLSTAGCTHDAAQPRTSVVPKASGFPSATEYDAISSAATQLATERAAMPCPSVTDCGRTTVFVDGTPISDGLVTQVAQGLYVHDFGGQATAARFTSLMRDGKSAFMRRVLTSTASTALLRLEAEVTLTEEQRRVVDTRLRTAAQSVASGRVSMTPAGSPHPLTAAEQPAYLAILRESIEPQVLVEALGQRSDPGKALRDFVKAALAKHRVEFTPGTGLHEADVLAYAAAAAATS